MTPSLPTTDNDNRDEIVSSTITVNKKCVVSSFSNVTMTGLGGLSANAAVDNDNNDASEDTCNDNDNINVVNHVDDDKNDASRSFTPITSGTSISSVSTSSHNRPGNGNAANVNSGASSIDSASSHSHQSHHSHRSYYYLSHHAVRSLPHYQYHGADLSYLYQHVLSPLAGWLVEHCTPEWLAPNAITLGGLAWMLVSYGLVWLECPGLWEGNAAVMEAIDEASGDGGMGGGARIVPAHIFLFNAVAMLIYQTLDNMDGKQARKTSSSSPLGLLFDHGCDAVNIILGSANWIAAMGLVPGKVGDLMHLKGVQEGAEMAVAGAEDLSIVSKFFGGDAMLATLLILCPMIAFYVSTWEQYYTGKLILPPFNGPSEGLVLGASLSFISFLYGPMFWQGTGILDGCIGWLQQLQLLDFLGIHVGSLLGRVRNLDLIVLSSVLALIQEITLKIFSVVRTYGIQTLRKLLPHAILALCTVLLIQLDPTILLRIPRTLMHLISGLFVEQTTQLMLDHMVEEEFRVDRRWSLLPLVMLVSMRLLGATSSFSMEAIDGFLLAYATGLWVYLAFKIRVAVYEICDVLGIWCFDIVTPHPNRKELSLKETGAAAIVMKGNTTANTSAILTPSEPGEGEESKNQTLSEGNLPTIVDLDNGKCVDLITKKTN